MNRQRLFLFARSLSFLGTIPSPSAGAACPPPLISEVPVDRAAGLDAGDRLGHAVALGGGVGAPPFAAVAAPLSDGRGNGAGEVRLYRVSRDAGAAPLPLRDPVSVVGSDTTAFDAFGFALSLAREAPVLAVGAPFHDEPNGGGNSGAVYLFEGTTFRQSARLIPPSPELDDQFGSSVALSADGSFLAVGAPGRRGRGAVFLYRGGPDGWTLERELSDPEGLPGDQFGLSVAVDPRGGTILAGAPQILGPTASGPGKALLFGGDGSRLRNLSVGGQVADAFGYSVAIASSGLLLVGAPGGDAPGDGDRAGAVYVFGSNDRTSKLAACAASKGAEMGFSLAAEGDTAIVGVRRGGEEKAGGALLFRCSASSCSAIGPLGSSNPGPGAELGRSVALAGDLALVGAPLADRGGEGDVGAAVAFDLGGVVVGRSRIEEAVPGKEGGFRASFEIMNRAGILATDLRASIDWPTTVSNPVVCRGPGSIGSSLRGRIELLRFALAPHERRSFEICGRLAANVRNVTEVGLRVDPLVGEVSGGDLEDRATAVPEPRASLVLNLSTPGAAIPGLPLERQVVLSVRNDGPSDLLNADFGASLSAGSFDRFGWCRDPQNEECSPVEGVPRDFKPRFTLRAGETAVFRGMGKVRSGATGRLAATLRVEPQARENDGQASRADRSIGLNPKAMFALEFVGPADAKIPGAPGEKVAYVFTVKNNGPSDVRAATLREKFERAQEGLSNCSWTCTTIHGRVRCPAASGTANRQRLDRFVAGNKVRIEIACTVDRSAANAHNTLAKLVALVEDLDPAVPGVQGGAALGPEIALKPEAHLAIQFDDPPAQAVPGEGVDLCFSVENQGPSDLPSTSVTVKTRCAEGASVACSEGRRTICSSTVRCPLAGNLDPHGLLFAAHTVGFCRLVVGQVDPAGRDSFKTTATVEGEWPMNGTASLDQTKEVELKPEATLEVEMKALKITPPVTDSPKEPWQVSYQVTVTNNGPSQANDLEIELFQPALLTKLTWCPNEDAIVGLCPDPSALGGTLPGSTPQELATLGVGDSRTYRVTGEIVEPSPPGPLVLAVTVISGDAAPLGRRPTTFRAVSLPEALIPPDTEPTAALVAEGRFEVGGSLNLHAFLDDPGLEGDTGAEAKFAVTLPAYLEVCDPASCSEAGPLRCNGQEVEMYGTIESGKVTDFTICTRVKDTEEMQPLKLHGKTSFEDIEGTFGESQDTHCPGNGSPRDTAFYLGEQMADSCGAFPIGE